MKRNEVSDINAVRPKISAGKHLVHSKTWKEYTAVSSAFLGHDWHIVRNLCGPFQMEGSQGSIGSPALIVKHPEGGI